MSTDGFYSSMQDDYKQLKQKLKMAQQISSKIDKSKVTIGSLKFLEDSLSSMERSMGRYYAAMVSGMTELKVETYRSFIRTSIMFELKFKELFKIIDSLKGGEKSCQTSIVEQSAES